jgi:hypothetical protein
MSFKAAEVAPTSNISDGFMIPLYKLFLLMTLVSYDMEHLDDSEFLYTKIVTTEEIQEEGHIKSDVTKISAHAMLTAPDLGDGSDGNTGKSLDLNQTKHMIALVKDILQILYWQNPIVLDLFQSLVGSVSSSHQIKSIGVSKDAESKGYILLLGQATSACTLIFNQWSARNERLGFMPSHGWHWDTITDADVAVIAD